jgi:hypothetical protein
MAARHPDKRALVLFSREIAQAGTGMAPGLTGIVGGRPKVSPVVRLFSCLIPKAMVPVSIRMGEEVQICSLDTTSHTNEPVSHQEPPTNQITTDMTVPLVKLAWARSGDKGNHSNIGVLTRDAAYMPYIAAALTPDAVANWMKHVLDPEEGRVSRWYLPGVSGLNFLLENALGGGGIASLRIDPQGKAFAQQLLEFPIPVSRQLADQLA